MLMHGLTSFAGVAIVALLLVAAAVVLGKALKPQVAGLRPKPLLTDNEKSFFRQLEDALPGHRVFPQVAFAAFLTEDPALPRQSRQAQRNKFNRKFVDFVVCDRNTLQIVALVELDDRTHVASTDRQRDELTQAAGYKTIRFQSKQKPTGAEIASRIQQLSGEGNFTPVKIPTAKKRTVGR
jgi:hypothetical protein